MQELVAGKLQWSQSGCFHGAPLMVAGEIEGVVVEKATGGRKERVCGGGVVDEVWLCFVLAFVVVSILLCRFSAAPHVASSRSMLLLCLASYRISLVVSGGSQRLKPRRLVRLALVCLCVFPSSRPSSSVWAAASLIQHR